MKRIMLLVTVALVMAAMMVTVAMPALADPPPITGGGNQFKGAQVVHCTEYFGFYGPGVYLATPSNNQIVTCL
jgi:hypothetical protein